MYSLLFQEVAKYESALGRLGVSISYAKSLISDTGSAEFAKRFLTRRLIPRLSSSTASLFPPLLLNCHSGKRGFQAVEYPLSNPWANRPCSVSSLREGLCGPALRYHSNWWLWGEAFPFIATWKAFSSTGDGTTRVRFRAISLRLRCLGGRISLNRVFLWVRSWLRYCRWYYIHDGTGFASTLEKCFDAPIGMRN